MATPPPGPYARVLKTYLAQGAETEQGIDILISLTEMESVPIRKALIRHYVNGADEAMACEMAVVPKSNFSRACKKLNKVAGKIDAYHELNYRKSDR